MHRSPLRQVVTRPSGPVDLEAATAYVIARLPGLDEPAASALAVVDVAGRARAEAGERTGLGSDALSGALARARKALRRALHPLPGSGWCERAERMLSEDLDGELVDPGPARLTVHLDNCSRCVEHERRLAQATDELVRSFLEAHPEPAAPPEPEPRPAPPLTAAPAAAPPWGVPEAEAPEEPRPAEPAPAEPATDEADVQDVQVAEPTPDAPPESTREEPAPAQAVTATPPPASPSAPPSTAPPTRPSAAPARVPAAAQREPKRLQRYTPPPPALPQERYPLARTTAWNLLLLVTVLLTLAGIAITVVGVTGGSV